MRRFPFVLAALGLTFAVAATAHAGPQREVTERWRITGHPTADGCGGEIALIARHLTFGQGWLHADVVNRRYSLTVDGGRRVGEGTFEEPYSCGPIRERWDLREVGDGVLEGTLDSEWRLRPSCEPCRVRFAVRAERMRR